MRKFKLFDAWLNIILIAASVIISLINMDVTFIVCYFIVGGWQVISMLVHTFADWFIEKGGERIRYHYVVASLAAITLTGALFNPILFVLMIVMIFAAPVMACYYAHLCYTEYYKRMQRPLAQLR